MTSRDFEWVDEIFITGLNGGWDNMRPPTSSESAYQPKFETLFMFYQQFASLLNSDRGESFITSLKLSYA